METLDTISNDTRLRDIYNYRWWKDNDNDNYFVCLFIFYEDQVMINKNGKSIMPGDQVYYNYGRRSNAFLLVK